jgi:hypothetical protein
MWPIAVSSLVSLHRQRVLRRLDPGDVAGDERVADRRAVAIVQLLDRALRPELRAVAAAADPLALGDAGLVGLAQGGGGAAFGAVGCGEEAREGQADRFVRLVADQRAAAGVPLRNAPFGIEHADRVVGDAAHQLRELPLAQGPCGVAPAQHVLRQRGDRQHRERIAADQRGKRALRRRDAAAESVRSPRRRRDGVQRGDGQRGCEQDEPRHRQRFLRVPEARNGPDDVLHAHFHHGMKL